MANKIRYGLEDYAQDRYERKLEADDAKFVPLYTAGQVQSEAFIPTNVKKTGEQVLTVGELILARRFDRLSAARENLTRVLNRNFQYDETPGTLYGVIQKQNEREVEKVIGRAYVNATANTVGDLVLSVVGMDGTKSDGGADFSNERPSITEWYAVAKRLCDEQKTTVSENE